MQHGIFISYRRDDAAGYAGRLYDRLATHFGAERVFMDVEGIEPGADFVEAIERAVGSCEALIVIIGDEWLAADGAGRRRLDDPTDFVRVETATALARGIRVVPVLVEGAVMPRADQLPADLVPLTRRQAVELSHKQWDASTAELIRTLERILNQNKPGVTKASPAEPKRSSDAPSSEPPPTGTRLFDRRYWAFGGVLVVGAVGALLYVMQPWRQDSLPAPAPATPRVSPGPDVAAVSRGPDVAAKGASTPPSVSTQGRDAESVAASSMPGRAESVAPATTPPPDKAKPPTEASPPPPDTTKPPTVASPPPPDKAKPPTVASPPSWERKPDAVTARPRILNFESRVADEKVLLCYGVENAASATITPQPGAVKLSAKECVSVAAEGGKKYTLTARGASGEVVSRTLAVAARPVPPPPQIVSAPEPPASSRPETVAEPQKSVPAAAPAAAAPTAPALAASFPRVGDTWQYRFRSLWKNVDERTYVHQVTAVSAREVRQTLSEGASGENASESRSFGPDPRFVEWRGRGYYYVEFNPFLQVFGGLEPGIVWKSLSVPIENPYFADWYSHGRVVGWDSVSVPAGTFKALRVELESSRQAKTNTAIPEPRRVRFVIWYAPDAKRTVKHVRTVWSPSGAKLDEDTYELVKYRVQ